MESKGAPGTPPPSFSAARPRAMGGGGGMKGGARSTDVEECFIMRLPKVCADRIEGGEKKKED